MPDNSVCPKCGADLSVLQTGSIGVHVPYLQWNDLQTKLAAFHEENELLHKDTYELKRQLAELTRDLHLARERIADLELSVSSDGLRMNLVDSLREKRRELAATREENETWMRRHESVLGECERLGQQLAERDAEIAGLRELLKDAYNRELTDPDTGDSITHKQACYCTDTGAGEWIDGKLVGDLLKCLPCRIRDFLASRRQGETST